MNVRALACCLFIAPLQGAHAESPTPEFAVKSIFQENLARKFADHCAGLAFDHGGYDRHVRERLGQFSDRGIHSRNIFKHFAPIQPQRYQRHIEAFNAQHGLNNHSSLDDFCRAAQSEARTRSPLGLMLKQVPRAGE